MQHLFALLFLSCCFFSTWAQPRFTQVIGGQGNDQAVDVCPTADGGYVVAGFTYSFGQGQSDIWVMKLDEFGEELWRQYLGEAGFDWAADLIETRDGNYTIAGYTQEANGRNSDAWLCQLNRYGEVMWTRTYGGEKVDRAKALAQTRDGGFAMAGYTYSDSKGSADMWLVRLNAVGDLLWEKRYGGKREERAMAIIETRDEGFLLGGYADYPEPNEADMALLKTDRRGKVVWRQIVRNPGNDAIEQVIETPDGGYLAAGWGLNEAENHALDGKLVKFSSTGTQSWLQSYGGQGRDVFYDIIPSAGRGFAIIGQSTFAHSGRDVWLLQVNEQGQTLRETFAKGPKEDWGHAISQTDDGGLLIAGGTKSYSQGGTDMLVFKTNPQGELAPGPFADNRLFSGTQPGPVTPAREQDPFKPDLYILTVGVSDYLYEPIDLSYAHTDAQAIGERFKTLEGSLFGQVAVRSLTNAQANLTNIKKGLSWLEQSATQKDVILIFISSHGALDNKGNLYILPTDFDHQDLFATGLNISQLAEGINGTPCKKLLLLDACHSGQSGSDLLALATAKGANVNDAIQEMMSAEAGITVMTSSSGKEFSYENPRWGHGAFTKSLLEGVDGEADYNHDQVISLAELNLYISLRVKELTGGLQHPFTPINLFGDIPLFVLD